MGENEPYRSSLGDEASLYGSQIAEGDVYNWLRVVIDAVSVDPDVIIVYNAPDVSYTEPDLCMRTSVIAQKSCHCNK